MVVADDDGVVIVAGGEVRAVTAKSREREEKEARNREQLSTGQLGIDIYGMRAKLKEKGLRYVASADELRASDADRHPLRDDARRHLQGRLFPRRDLPADPAERDKVLLGGDGLARSRVRSTALAAPIR